MNTQEFMEEGPAEVEQLVDALLDGDLAKYLLDSTAANDLVKEIAAETGLPRAAVRIAFKLLAPLLVKKSEAAANWFGRRLLNRSAAALARLPGYALIVGALLALSGKLDRDVIRRQQLDAILAGERPPTDVEHAEGLSRELRLGLRQLAELGAVHAHVDLRFGELLARLNPQPPLALKLLEQNEINRLKFGAQRVPFIGRKVELLRLREFLESSRPFTWWLVTGSSGQGKSRLALELCLRAGTAWRCGFFPETSAYDQWDNWQPESATLIVADYVATRIEQLRKIIISLLSREHTDPLDAPVRLLLLERSKERCRWDQLISSDQTSYAIEQCQFASEPLELGPMSEDELWQTIAAILIQVGTPLPDRVGTLATLAEIDPERRPLFAAFAADALVASGNIRGWDRDRLLRDVLDRERRFHWRPAGATGPYENLLCLATMIGGLPITILADPPPEIQLPTQEDFQPAIYEAMTGKPPSESAERSPIILNTLQPDILGEFFVLEHLKPPHPGTNQPVYRFKRAALNLSFLNAIWFVLFLMRAKDDFKDHGTLPLLVELPIEAHPHEQRLRQLWALVTSWRIIDLRSAGRVDEARAQFDELAELVEEYPEEVDLRLELAKGADNLITAYSDAGRLDDSRALFELLSELAAAHPEDAEVRLRFAQGVFTLMSAYDDAGRLEDARIVANTARDALRSAQFTDRLRKQFGEGDAAKVVAWMHSLLYS